MLGLSCSIPGGEGGAFDADTLHDMLHALRALPHLRLLYFEVCVSRWL